MTADDEFEFDVFLSHSAKDKAVVTDVAERLRKDGLRVWFDTWVLKPGDSIPARIHQGLEGSRVQVLFMSANAFGSDWAQMESSTFRFRDPLNTTPPPSFSESTRREAPHHMRLFIPCPRCPHPEHHRCLAPIPPTHSSA